MTRTHRVAWAFGILWCGPALSLPAQHCHTPLRGYVFDAETREPLPFATVRLPDAGRGTQTDESGAFAIPDLCTDSVYAVEVSHIGCIHQTQVVKLSETTELLFQLVHDDALLQEIIVAEKAYTPPPIQAESVVRREDLSATQGLNLGETLRRLPGVSTLNTGATISKPVIQGLHSNRIAVVQNNLAIEGQQWGSEHAPEVDPFAAAQIRVVKGASGVRYGVGAMAGAVVLEPAPLREADGLGGWLSLGGFSNGRSGVASGALDYRLPGSPFALRVQGTAKRSGNLRAPDYWLGNTGAAELNGSATAGWAAGRWRHELSGSVVNQRFGILRAAHIGNLTDLQKAIESDTPRNNPNYFTYDIERPYQDVQHSVGQFKTSYRLSDQWKLSGQLARQFNRRREFDVVRSNSSAAGKPQQSFRLATTTLDVTAEHLPINHWQGGVGVQAFQQHNEVGKDGLIPDFDSYGASVWAMERWRRFPSPWELEFGLRYDYRSARAVTEGNLMDIDTTVHFANLSGTAGVAYHLNPYLRIQLNSGYAWRPPSVYELFARGVHHGTATYEQGRPDLLAEKSWNTQLSLVYARAGKEVSLTLYRNQARDFIYLDPQNDFVLTIRGAYPAYFYAQADAVLQGFDARVDWPLFAGLSVEAAAGLVRGYRMAADSGETDLHRDWLPLMPVDRFQYGLRYTFGRKPDRSPTFLRLSATTALEQTRIPEAGLLAPAPPAFTFLTLDAAHTLRVGKQPLEIGLMIQNLTNLRYREYLNFFRFYADEPGVNAGLRVRMGFE
ncbi:MAG: TonB-dependent receptor [Saprospiraceae bacterium]|nr:TonB-dependent receptor [Saprospiraceae bacterium]